MNKYLKDKVVLITGASSGLGRHIALESAKCGAIVLLCARREDLLFELKNECEQLSKKPAYYFVLDISDEKSIEKVSKAVQEKFKFIDVLVNNAGFGHFTQFIDFDLEIAQRMFAVNTLGLISLTQKLARDMSQRKNGHIINIVSQAGKMASPQASIYSATKFATLGFSNAIRLELSHNNILVTTVNTGPIDTEFFDNAKSNRAYVDKMGWIMLNPSKLAKQVVNIMGSNKREINKPFLLEIAAKFYCLFPKLGDIIAKQIFKI